VPPLQLTDAEMTVLRQPGEPIDQRQRSAFLEAVAQKLEAGGPSCAVRIGSVHRVGRVVQRRFFDPPQLLNASPVRRGGAGS
jgi:hypothetical protein